MHPALRTLVTGVAAATFALPTYARAEDQDLQKKDQDVQKEGQDLQKKVDSLTKQVEALKRQVNKTAEKSLSRWLTIGGEYRFRIDSLRGEVPNYYQFTGPTSAPVLTPGFKPTNDTLMTNRFALDLKAKATQDVTVTARLLMYKVFGMQTDRPVDAGFFADRSFLMDGSVGHVPGDNTLRVDQVYATWSNIADLPLWFSVGRRPSTGGSPTFLRRNDLRPGNGGVPGLLVDYAFDGGTIGYAPEFLPGGYVKVCGGRGFEAGYNSSSSLKDTDMVGVQVVPVDTDPLRIDFQWNKGFHIFDNPNNPGNQLGDIDWYGVGVLSKLEKVGPGDLNLFASGGMSITHPNGQHALLAGPGSPDSGAGLLVNGADVSERKGYGGYVGVRYDLPFGTKLGAEYNHGSLAWIPFDPAADDVWTSKLGTRGNVYEGYLIQELPLPAVASFVSKAFFRIGYQYYDFTYTGSNNWVGAPVKISELTASPFNAQMLPPLKSAHDVYATFEVRL